MAEMRFDISMRGAEECLAYLRSLNDGVEALSAGDHEKAREHFDRADAVVADLRARDQRPAAETLTINIAGPIIEADARELGVAVRRALDASASGARRAC